MQSKHSPVDSSAKTGRLSSVTSVTSVTYQFPISVLPPIVRQTAEEVAAAVIGTELEEKEFEGDAELASVEILAAEPVVTLSPRASRRLNFLQITTSLKARRAARQT